MRSYSLIANTGSRALFHGGLADHQQIIEAKAKDFWSSNYSIDQIDEYASLVCEGDLLLEFSLKDFVVDNLSNLVQAAIGASLEAGISVAGLGSTAPAGIAAESATDLTFFGMSAASAVVAGRGIFNGLEEIKETITRMFSMKLENTPLEIYQAVEDAISSEITLRKWGLISKLNFQKLVTH
jgi:hypothetical protein